jgi:hypothetical protein
MKPHKLSWVILQLNAALDTGEYDSLTVQEVGEELEEGDLIEWLKEKVPDADLSFLSEDELDEYKWAIEDCHAAFGFRTRKWGVNNRALCLLIAWTNEWWYRLQQPPEDRAWLPKHGTEWPS